MAAKKTIYYLPRFGQLGNQLALLAHLLAFAAEYDFEVVHFASKELVKNLKKNEIEKSPVRFSEWLAKPFFSYGINKLVKLVSFNGNYRFGKTLFINKEYNADELFSGSSMPSTIVITNWLFRFYSGVIKYQDAIRETLSFDETRYANASRLLQTAQKSFPLHTLVGVHVRRGDYASFFDGKYLYDNAVYYAKMNEIAGQLNKSVFVICSNEEISFSNEKGLHILYAKGSPTDDLFLLSQCEYIMGPPSTFSSWSAFAGDKHLLFLESASEDVRLDRFTKYYL